MVAPDAEVDADDFGMAICEFGEDPLGVGEHEPVVIRSRERARPRVEQLEGPGAVSQLHVDERDRALRQSLHHPVPQQFVGVHHRLGVPVGAARAALDEIAGHRERRPGERQQRHLGWELGGEQIHRVGDVGDVIGFERPQPGQIGDRTERPLGDGAGPGLDVDAEPHGMGWDDDVAVEHGGIDAVAPDGLHRDVGRQLGLFDRVEDRSVAPNASVLGEAASGLPHEPHRRVLRSAATGSGEERGVAGG